MPTFDHWRDVWNRLGAPVSDAGLFRKVMARYQEPHRHYHTLQHLDECFEHVAAVRATAQHPAEVEMALWFHDVIYDVPGKDNEQRSADWAAREMQAAGLPAQQCQRVHALIMATTHAAAPSGIDAQLLVDVDLVSLAAPAARFDECERQIRAENAAVPDPEYRAGRKALLQRFLARPRIYGTPRFHDAFEAQARLNLAHSLERL